MLDALDGCDLIVHAGDITSDEDFVTLGALAPLRLCLGNNDWAGEYGPEVTRKVRFEYEGLQFCVCHYRQDLTGERLMWACLATRMCPRGTRLATARSS